MRKKMVKETVDNILSLSIFKAKKNVSGIDKALLDIKEGRVYQAKDTDNMFAKILEPKGHK